MGVSSKGFYAGAADYGTHYATVKAANRYDLWRRELGFESFEAMHESMEKAALLLGEPPAKYFDDCFNAWNGA